MTQIKPLYRYRVPILRRGQDGSTDPALREHVYLHAPNATAAQLLARAVSGVETALEPERLGEVELPPIDLQASLSECGAWLVWA